MLITEKVYNKVINNPNQRLDFIQEYLDIQENNPLLATLVEMGEESLASKVALTSRKNVHFIKLEDAFREFHSQMILVNKLFTEQAAANEKTLQSN
jgi:hypothetical protein